MEAFNVYEEWEKLCLEHNEMFDRYRSSSLFLDKVFSNPKSEPINSTISSKLEEVENLEKSLKEIRVRMKEFTNKYAHQ